MSKQQKNLSKNKPFESDAAKVVHRHLSDPNHVISEEEIAGVRVGLMPSGEYLQEVVEDATDHVADKKLDSESDTVPGAQKSTPWDVVG